MSVSRVDPHLADLDQDERARSIVFHFVNPALALWRLMNGGSNPRLDEPEQGG
jgi:hypothetical protein